MAGRTKTATAELKTKPTAASVESFLRQIEDPRRRQDCMTVAGLMRQATGREPRMWGASIVGFGDLHYRYATGREGDTFVLGFAPRKDALTLYFCPGIERWHELLSRLGKHRIGKGCLYIRDLAEVDLACLGQLLAAAAADLSTADPAATGADPSDGTGSGGASTR